MYYIMSVNFMKELNIYFAWGDRKTTTIEKDGVDNR